MPSGERCRCCTHRSPERVTASRRRKRSCPEWRGGRSPDPGTPEGSRHAPAARARALFAGRSARPRPQRWSRGFGSSANSISGMPPLLRWAWPRPKPHAAATPPFERRWRRSALLARASLRHGLAEVPALCGSPYEGRNALCQSFRTSMPCVVEVGGCPRLLHGYEIPLS